MSSNCEYYQYLISQMLDQDLMDAETQALREHIRTCRDCRALCAAFSSMTLSLRQDMAEPPKSLSQGVMERIYTYEAQQQAAPEPETAPTPNPNTIDALSPRGRTILRRWPTYVAAACLVVLVGTGLLFSSQFRAGSASDTAAAMPETAMAQAMDEAETAVVTEGEWEEAAKEEPMEAGAAADTDAGISSASTADQSARSDQADSIYTLQNPATVPAGREEDFQALLTDAGWPEGEPDTSWHCLMAAEYHGVIYEFLTDDQEQYLLWHDAAEGLYTHSAASVADLWDIFDN
jgi:anti-sigma factor RsiW